MQSGFVTPGILGYQCIRCCSNLTYSQKGQMSLQASTETLEFMEKASCLRMMFWLTVYRCLYNQEVRESQI